MLMRITVLFRSILFLTILLLFMTGCSNFPVSPGPGSPILLIDLLQNPEGKFTPTPTPFQPASSEDDPGLFPGEIATNTPTPGKGYGISLGLDRPAGQINILLLGSDWRPGEGYRTDVILLLSLMPEQGIATITSFPRDLYVYIPGYGYQRINAAQPYGGFELTRKTFEENFDAPVDYYMMTNFAGFVSIIDTLGGITVNASHELYDRCDLPQAINKMCYIPAGRVTMNGETALWYVRSRKSTDDFDRTRRAQEVIITIAQKAMSLNAASRAGELFNLFRNAVETDITLEVVVKALPLATKIMQEPSTMQRYAITEADITHHVVPETGAMVLIPNNESIAEIIRQAIYPLTAQN